MGMVGMVVVDFCVLGGRCARGHWHTGKRKGEEEGREVKILGFGPWSLVLLVSKEINVQTGFFVETTNFVLQDFRYSSNLHRRVAVQIFRADHQIFRYFFSIQRIFKILHDSSDATVFGVQPMNNDKFRA